MKSGLFDCIHCWSYSTLVTLELFSGGGCLVGLCRLVPSVLPFCRDVMYGEDLYVNIHCNKSFESHFTKHGLVLTVPVYMTINIQ